MDCRLFLRRLGVSLAAALVTMGGAAPAFQNYELTNSSDRKLRTIGRLVDDPSVRDVERAIDIAAEIARDEDLPPYDRSVGYELKAQFEYALRRDDSAYADDLILAIALAPEDDLRRRGLVEKASEALLRAGRLDDALAFADTYESDFPSFNGGADLYTAEIHAARGEVEEAIDAIGPVNEPGDTMLEKRLRYALLLTEGRYAEARAVLQTFGTDAIYADAVKRELEALRQLEDRSASRAERRERGLRFAAVTDEVYRDAEPLKRVPPTGFERCVYNDSIGRAYNFGKRTERVAMEFDIATDGSVLDPRVIETTNTCLDRFALQAVRQWEFRPAVVDGKPTVRRGVRTTIVFEFTD